MNCSQSAEVMSDNKQLVHNFLQSLLFRIEKRNLYHSEGDLREVLEHEHNLREGLEREHSFLGE